MTPDLKPAAHGLKRYVFYNGNLFQDNPDLLKDEPRVYLASEVDSLLSPPRAGMTEEEFMKCIYDAGEPTRLIFEQGPYCIDTLTAGGDKLLEAINRHFSATQPPEKQP